MSKRIVSVFMAIVLCFSMMPIHASADMAVEEGRIESKESSERQPDALDEDEAKAEITTSSSEESQETSESLTASQEESTISYMDSPDSSSETSSKLFAGDTGEEETNSDAHNVSRISVNGWSSIRISESMASAEILEMIASFLPNDVTIHLDDGNTITATVGEKWVPDLENERWVNTVNTSSIKDNVSDPDGILDEISIVYETSSYVGSLSVNPSNPIVDEEGYISLRRYNISTDYADIYQVNENEGGNGYTSILRYNNESDNFDSESGDYRFTIDAWKAPDAGHWFGLYYSSYSAYVVGPCNIAPSSRTVTRVNVDGWGSVNIKEAYVTEEILNKIAAILPREVIIRSENEYSTTAQVQGNWMPDIDNSCWTNSVSVSVLPEDISDPNSLLSTISIPWITGSTGGLSVSSDVQIIGKSATFNMYRYMLIDDRAELYQVKETDDGFTSVLRFDKESENYSQTESGNYVFNIDSWKSTDAGDWFGVYRSSYSVYIAGYCTIIPTTYTLTLRENGGILRGNDVYYTNENYQLTELPETPARNGYTFTGWYSSATDGEPLSFTLDTVFSEDIVAYAHWSKEYMFSTSSSESELSKVDGQATSNTDSHIEANAYGWRIDANIIYNEDGTFTTVDGSYSGENVIVTKYSSGFSVLETKNVPVELSRFCGFFSGEVNNYIVFAQNNEEEDNEKEVFRVVKYDKEFNRLSSAAVKNCYTCWPDFSSMRMAEYGNELTIHTSRTRYLTPDDGLHHQSQLTIVLDTDSMTVTNDLGAFQDNHVSHSFNQYVLYDGDSHVLLDHGDAYPRSIYLQKPVPSQRGGIYYKGVHLFRIPGPTGDNWTGVCTGGFEQSSNNYIASISTVNQRAVVYAADGSHNHTLDSDERDVVLLVCDKDLLDNNSVRQDYLTNYYRTGKTASLPYLVKIDRDRFMVLWEEFISTGNNTSSWYKWNESVGVRYAIIDGSGSVITDMVLLPSAKLSQYCQPVAHNNHVTWYVDEDSVRTFYTINTDNSDTWTVTYVANNGTSEKNDTTVIKGEAINLPNNTFSAPQTPAGQIFKAWSIDGTKYQPGDSYTPQADTTITAVWYTPSPDTWTVTYVANNGTSAKNDTTVIKGEAINLPNNTFSAPQTPAVQIFKAWSIDGTEYQPGDSYTPQADTTITAVWYTPSPDTWTVTYVANNGTNAKNDTTVIKGEAINLPNNTFSAPQTPAGQIFKAWSIDGTEYQPGDSYTPQADTTITAVWYTPSPDNWTVTYVANNGTSETNDTTVIKGESINLPNNTFSAPQTPAGQIFKAWNIDGTEYQPGDSYTPQSDTTVTAVWGSADDFAVTVTNGSITNPESDNGRFKPDTRVTIEANISSFDHWTGLDNVTLVDGSTKAPTVTFVMPASDVNPVARSGGCYVATAVYGSYDCPEVWTLRRFRDKVLAKTWYGRLFIHFYYAVSPTAVRFFGQTQWFQTFFRALLDPWVADLQANGFESTPYQDQTW